MSSNTSLILRIYLQLNDLHLPEEIRFSLHALMTTIKDLTFLSPCLSVVIPFLGSIFYISAKRDSTK
jgi:hypothetical protein